MIVFSSKLEFHELTEVIDICSEVSFLYSSFGPTSIELPRLSKKVIPFHYYQGLTTTCYYLLWFSRKGVPATYPPKFQVYNMLAAIVENVNGIPLGTQQVVQKYFHELFGILVPSSPDAGNETPVGLGLGAGLYSFITNTAGANSAEDNIRALPAVWEFIFTHGHPGLVAVFLASYNTLSGTHKEDLEGDLRTAIIKNALEYLTDEEIGTVLAEAEKIIESWKVEGREDLLLIDYEQSALAAAQRK